MSELIRLDRLLVEQGYFETRSMAQAAIEAGGVQVNGVIARKSALRCPRDAAITAEPAHPYVSRGGVKLAHALDTFGVSAEGRICLDLGASTGGFTQVLLLQGAKHVTAVDVGSSQFHPSLSSDPRIRLLEKHDARQLHAQQFEDAPDLLVADMSFIGLEKALGPALMLAKRPADLVALFKPQFQVGRTAVGKGGLVTDDSAVERAMEAFTAWLQDQSWSLVCWTESPIPGGDGNAEKFVHARIGKPARLLSEES